VLGLFNFTSISRKTKHKSIRRSRKTVQNIECWAIERNNLGGLLGEQDSGMGLGRRDDFLHQNPIQQWDQTLRHLRNEERERERERVQNPSVKSAVVLVLDCI